MSRFGITFEQVEQVVEMILKKGENPTIERIRIHLGTGSASTISKYLTEWRNKRAHGGGVGDFAFPPDPVNQAVAKVWQQLQDENLAKLEALELQAAEKSALAVEEKNIAIKENQQLLADNQDLRALLMTARQQNAELINKNTELTQMYKVLESTLAVTEEKQQTFIQWANETIKSTEEKYHHMIKQYEDQFQQAKTHYENEVDQIKELSEAQRHKHIVEIDNLKTSNQKLQAQLIEKDKTIMDLTSKVGQLSSQFNSQIESWTKLTIYSKVFEEKFNGTCLNIISELKENKILLKSEVKALFSNLDKNFNSSKEEQSAKVLHESVA